MTTTSAVYKKIIFTTIRAKSPENVHIHDLYKEADRAIVFDSQDLKSTTLRKKSTGEASWKRNLRNCLQGFKSSGALANPAKNLWSSPVSAGPKLSTENAWNLVLSEAEKAFNTQTNWSSVKESHKYQILRIGSDKIDIKRLDAKKPTYISKGEVTRAITALNACGGSTSRRTINHTVAKEVSIVFLHPDLSWDALGEKIVASRINFKLIDITLNEASNDDIEKRQLVARKIRQGQPKLRKKLLDVYNNECCISRTGPKSVLQAAHIQPHAIAGLNESTNAILLRSDLHDLFDDGLLAIDPEQLQVKIHPSLRTSYYMQYHNVKLVSRKDKLLLNKLSLEVRWKNCEWVSQ